MVIHVEELQQLLLGLLVERRTVRVARPRVQTLRRQIRTLRGEDEPGPLVRRRARERARGAVLRKDVFQAIFELRDAVPRASRVSAERKKKRGRKTNEMNISAERGVIRPLMNFLTFCEIPPSASRSWTPVGHAFLRPCRESGSGVSGRGDMNRSSNLLSMITIKLELSKKS